MKGFMSEIPVPFSRFMLKMRKYVLNLSYSNLLNLIKSPYMKTMLRIYLTVLAIFSITYTNAQSITNAPRVLGTPCPNCATPLTSARGSSNTVQNGNATCVTSYSTTACGLGYVTGSVRLGQRGSIAGVAQPAAITISGIPACAVIVKAFLYGDASGNGIAVTSTVKNPALVTGSYPMTIIGSDVDKCWGYSGSYSYRADITPAVSGNGNYMVSGLPTGSPNDFDGASIVIIYSDPTQSYTGHMVIADGAHEKSGGNITDNMTGFVACANSIYADAFWIVGDLQKIANTPINFNSATSNYTELAANDNWWNLIQGTAAPLTAGQ
ncbi:MAG: hypothetical protein ACXVPD_07755, partial [Bacteroidia bacterium]